ncbi:aminodeoxychorismate synthase component I [Nocardia carnea]|uniref:aminodeoxychorismate synthase component I n=1 Tax=Nocardia carnea TaxID=37328 RepID=UPI002458BA39|nr:aminodeoxychorismate synthase component I [Nocardia carnea]
MRTHDISARFDDLRAGSAVAFPGFAYDLVAQHPSEVEPVLAELERAVARGWWAFGFVSYEAAAGFALPVADPVPGLPLAWFGISTAPVRVPLVSTEPAEQRGSYRVAWRPVWTPEVHRERVEAVREWIAAGETYQTNLTTRLETSFVGDPAALYADLALAQRGAYNAFLDLGRFVVAGASPELFFDLRNNELLMRPMKGTAPRGATPAADAENVRRLCASEKERAENIMIVDLVRNDVSRIAETGSVRVTSLCVPEQYETLHTLTSDVRARLHPGTTILEVFRALFPCGSVTGAPKERTMELITALEDGPRGVYCGAVGVVAPGGRAHFNVAIRTVLVDRDSGIAVYGSGGGITWGSRPAPEYAELQVKAAVLGSTCGAR